VTYTKVQLEDSPLSLITMIEPDIIFVGDDYTIKDVVGGHIAKVEIIPRLPGFSTTALTK
jgi:bifunctional ADP-heptose synthase (sugar kinase/adenylyltransferase)